MSTPTRVGIIGAGYISAAYLRAARDFQEIAIISCADAVRTNAETRAKEFGLRAQELDELLEDKSIDLVLNLTTPQSHVPISLQALEAGKHVYSEKPLGLSIEETGPLLEAAHRNNVRLGCAPDTFLGGGQQTVRKLIDDGAIANRSAAPHSFLLLVRKAGILIRNSTTKQAADRSSTWDPITSLR